VPFCAYLFHAGVDWMWESTAVTVLALSMMAVAIAAAGTPLEKRPSVARVRVPMAIAALLVVLIQIPGLVSTTSARDSQKLFNRGQFQAALGRATDAIDAQPWASSPYVQRALVEEAMSRLPAAQVDLDRAIATRAHQLPAAAPAVPRGRRGGRREAGAHRLPARQGAAPGVGVLRAARAVTPTTLT